MPTRVEISSLSPDQEWMLFDPSPAAEQQWIESLLTIPDVSGKIVPFILKPQQKAMLYNRTGRDITVKGRQTRASSLILARNLRRMTTGEGLQCLTMTQDDQTTDTFRARIKHHLKDLAQNGLEYKIETDNDSELVLGGFGNRYMWGSGMESVAGRAYTGHIVHLSEFAHWPDRSTRKLIGGILPSIPGYPFGQLDIESTPNGAEGMYYEMVQDSKAYHEDGEFTTHFYAWWEEARYRAGTEVGVCDLVFTKEQYEKLCHNFEPSEIEMQLMKEFGLDMGQIIWRRVTKRTQDKTDAPFLQEYPEGLKGCFLQAGGNYFATPGGINFLEQYAISVTPARELKTSLPFRAGTIQFPGADLHVWQPPQAGQPYVVWVDCAGGGLDDSADYTGIQVINALTKTQVARLNIKIAPQDAAPIVVAISTWYNTALLGGERDAFGSVCVEEVKRIGYGNLWYWIDPAKPINSAKLITDPWGHPTQIRSPILTCFREHVIENTIRITDELTLQQMGAFTLRKVSANRETLKASGKPGVKDDLVMSMAGAIYIATLAAARYNAKESKDRELIIVGSDGMIRRTKSRIGSRKPWLR